MRSFMQHYNSYRKFLTEKFGGPVLKVPLNGGFSCPNRDGTLSDEGCFFCDNRSFSPVALTPESATETLKTAIGRNKKRFKHVIPYFQPFSNTYASKNQLHSVYEPVLAIEGVCGLAIGTRPDCFQKGVFDYLGEIASRTYLTVELGLQSGHESTLKAMNRGHSVKDFLFAVEQLKKRNISVVVHVMLGLPGEDLSIETATAQLLAAQPIDGIKIHQLMIIENTKLAEQYHQKQVSVLSLEAYTARLCNFLQWLPQSMHIHRIMADSTRESGLIAPLWSSEKNKSLTYIQEYMSKHNIYQGALRK